jgi:hypothetical protein
LTAGPRIARTQIHVFLKVYHRTPIGVRDPEVFPSVWHPWGVLLIVDLLRV